MYANLLDVLVQRKIITAKDIPIIQKEMEETGASIEEVLVQHGATAAEVLDAKGEYHGIPARTISEGEIPYEILKYIPEESALHYRFVPIGLRDGVLEVGFVDPDNLDSRDALNFISTKVNLPFKIFLISEEDFEKVKESYRGLTGEVNAAVSELETEFSNEEGIAKDRRTPQQNASADTNARIVEDAPVTKIVATMLEHAVEENASDIHVEPVEGKIRVRFRVDGTLNTSITLPYKAQSALVARIKILSNMRLDEKRKPQDGRFFATIAGRKIDFRVSTFPTYYGEKVVMRILDSQKGVRPLDGMGLTPRNLALIRKAIDKPYGMILISGPTGSGKSTTLYSMLNEVDKEHENVLSLEDPVEYNMPGMNQSQVRPEIGYTFASGLRTTLRQDPDIIMVGEIRDKETAQLAVQAALTGHLVFSTIHTNNAAGVIPRLIDMGVDPFLIAPTLVLAIAQRLTKKLCVNGGKEMPVEGHVKDVIDHEFKDVPEQYRNEIPTGKFVYEAAVTPDCPKGTSGRAAVIEVLEMTPELERVILKNPTEDEIMKVAKSQGMFTMRQDAMIKAFKREIPFEEAISL